MSKNAVLTIVSNNYIPYAATLMSSLAESNPDYERYVFLCDEDVGNAAAYAGNFTLIQADSIGIPSFADMALRYDVMELNTAIKPFAMKWLFDKKGADNVIYLDPDIFVYRKLDELDETLSQGHSIVLTPHIMKPVEDGYFPDEYSMLQAGTFNLGFIAASRNEEAIAFLEWWGRQLRTRCHADFKRGMFTDQKWCDLAPSLLQNLAILRNPGYNVAYWNLFQRRFSGNQRRGIEVDGSPLAFFHFSGLTIDEPQQVSKHQNRLHWADIKPLQPLFKKYRKRLADFGWKKEAKASYSYNRVDGLRLVPVIRELYADRFSEPNMQNTIDRTFILGMCNAPTTRTLPDGPYFSALMAKIYEQRGDLQVAFNLNEVEGARAYADWFEKSANREYGLEDEFVMQRLIRPSEEEQANLASQFPSHIPNGHRTRAYRIWRKLRRYCLDRLPIKAASETKFG